LFVSLKVIYCLFSCTDIFQGLFAAPADLGVVPVEASQHPTLAGLHIGTIFLDVIVAFGCRIAERSDRVLQLRRGIVECVFATAGKLVFMGINAGKQTVAAGRNILAEGFQFVLAAFEKGFYRPFRDRLGHRIDILIGRGSASGQGKDRTENDGGKFYINVHSALFSYLIRCTKHECIY
jgi:hypothetical protein